MKPLFGRIKKFQKSGAYLYLPSKLIEHDDFPFRDDDVVKLEIDKKNQAMTVSTPQWWELLDWSKMPDAFDKLPPETKENIKRAGILTERS